MYYNLDWPELPQKYIDEANNSEFKLIHEPSILYWAPTSFVESDLYKKISNKYEFPDGRKEFEKAIKKNPEKWFTKEVLDLIEEGCQADFLYGKYNAEVVEDGTGN